MCLPLNPLISCFPSLCFFSLSGLLLSLKIRPIWPFLHTDDSPNSCTSSHLGTGFLGEHSIHFELAALTAVRTTPQSTNKFVHHPNVHQTHNVQKVILALQRTVLWIPPPPDFNCGIGTSLQSLVASVQNDTVTDPR